MVKIFINSLPKSGTNLIAKLVRLMGVDNSGKSVAFSSILGRYQFAKSCMRLAHFSGNNVPIGLEFPVCADYRWLAHYLKLRDNQYISGHAAYTEQLAHLLKVNNVSQIQVFRHPAAVLVSWAKFIAEDRNNWHPSHKIISGLSLEQRCRFLLTGGLVQNGKYYQSSFAEILHRTEGWIDSSAMIVRYEDIVGSKGGGNDDIQRSAIASVMRHIGKEFNRSELDRLQEQLYGGTHTFRSGQIDSWRSELSESTLQLIQDKLGTSNYSRVLQ